MNPISSIAKSFEIITEMLGDRLIYDEESMREIKDFCHNNFESQLQNQKNVFHFDFPKCSLRVMYNMHVKFKVADIKKSLDTPYDVLLVCREMPGTLALKGLHEASKKIEVFNLAELQYNVSNHVLVPKHVPIRSEEDIQEVLKFCGVKSKAQLQYINHTDAMARYLALKVGEIVKIDRISPSAGEMVAYRLCIPGGVK